MKNKFEVLFSKHKKHLPKRLEGTWMGESCKYGFMIFASAWLLQGMRIMNWRETALKLLLDAVLTGLLLLTGCNWIIALLIAHTLNFTFNGQLFAMFTHMGATGVSARYFLIRTERIAAEAAKAACIDAAIAYGSLSRGCYKNTSDIDLRIIPSAGETNWWRCALWAVWQRAKAFVNGYPLDLYVYDASVVVKRMRTDELPIMLYEKNGAVRQIYPQRVPFEDFVMLFTEKNLK